MADVLVPDAALINQDPIEVVTTTDAEIVAAVDNNSSSGMTGNVTIGMTIPWFRFLSKCERFFYNHWIGLESARIYFDNNVEFQHPELKKREGSMNTARNNK